MTTILADLILALHVMYASFVLGGLLVLPFGLGFGWSWVRTRWFRCSHLVCTALVAVEAVIGLTCPLTWIEHRLLVAAGTAGYDRSFIGHLLAWLLYYDTPAWVLTTAYLVVALIVLLLFCAAPPRPRPRVPRRGVSNGLEGGNGRSHAS